MNAHRKFIALTASIGLFLAPVQVLAQSQTVRQSGPVTGGHASCWTYNGIIQDCGTATGTDASLTTLGIVQDGGLPFCVVDTKIHTGPYRQFCFSVSSAGVGTISLNPFNGAGPLTMDIVINGVTYTFPQVIPPPPIAATPLRNIAAGATDTITSNDANGSVAWNSATTSAKTETLPVCNVPVNGFTITVKDEVGTAGTYPITISGAQNIGPYTSYIMPFNYQAVTLQCNGAASSWIVKEDTNIVRPLSSIAQLQALGQAAPQYIRPNVSSFRAGTNDGGGGTFDYASTCPASVNGGTLVSITSGPAGSCYIREIANAAPYSILWFGAVSDAKKLTDTSISSSSPNLCSASYTFISTDVGKTVVVWGAGPTGAVLGATISSISTGCAVLSANASTTVSTTGVAYFGTDNTAAINATATAALTNKTNWLVPNNQTFGYAGHISVTATGGQTIGVVGTGTLLFLAPQVLNPSSGSYVTETLLATCTPTDAFYWNGPTLDLGFQFGSSGNGYYLPGFIGSTFYSTPATIPSEWNYGAFRVNGCGTANVSNQTILGSPRAGLFSGTSAAARMNVVGTGNAVDHKNAYTQEGYLGFDLQLWKHSDTNIVGNAWNAANSNGGLLVTSAGIVCQRCEQPILTNVTTNGAQIIQIGGIINNVVISSLSRSSTTATATTSSPHGLETGSWVFIVGTAQTQYQHKRFQVTVTDTTHFTFQVSGSPTSPATIDPRYSSITETEMGDALSYNGVNPYYPAADTSAINFFSATMTNTNPSYSSDFGISAAQVIHVNLTGNTINGASVGGIAISDFETATLNGIVINNVGQLYSTLHTPGAGTVYAVGMFPDQLNIYPTSIAANDVAIKQTNTPDVTKLGSCFNWPLTSNTSGTPAQIANFPGSVSNVTCDPVSGDAGYSVAVPTVVLSITAHTGTPITGEVCGNGAKTARYVAATATTVWMSEPSSTKFGAGEVETCTSGATFTTANPTGETYTGTNIVSGSIIDFQRSLAGVTVP